MVKNKGEDECLSFFFLLGLTFYTAEDLVSEQEREHGNKNKKRTLHKQDCTKGSTFKSIGIDSPNFKRSKT